MLANQKVTAAKGDTTVSGNVTTGCPQGGVLSPLLWNLVVDELLETIESQGCRAVGYADDILIIVRGQFLDTLKETTQRILKILEAWCATRRLSVNPKKTEIVVFTKRRKWNKDCNLILNGERLQLSSESKYLGVTLDSKLNWKTHLEKKCKGLTTSMWQLRRALGSSWGLRPSTMMWIYEAILKPRLTYAAVVWGKRTELKTAKAALERARGLVLRGATGAAMSTPTAALGALLGIGPLSNSIIVQAAKTYYRTKNAQGVGLVGRCGPRELTAGGVLEMPTDRAPRTLLLTKSYKISLSKREDWNNNTAKLPSDGEIWYTDGSRKGGFAGAGVYRRRGGRGIIIPLGKYTTIMQAELVGIQAAALLALQEGGHRRVYICSDSMAALTALQGLTTESKLILDCHIVLNNLARDRAVELHWVPAHSGIRGNMIADDLARLGAGQALVGPEPAVGISYSQIKEFFHLWEAETTANSWREAEGCRQAKAFIGEENPAKWANKFALLSRQGAKTMVGLITGHCETNYHRFNTGRTQSPDCRFCATEDETTLHILCECEALSNIRSLIFGQEFLEEPCFKPEDTQKLLQFWSKIMG